MLIEAIRRKQVYPQFKRTLPLVNYALIFAVPTYYQHVFEHRNSDRDLNELLALFDPYPDYDLHYDQRQKGEENLRVKLDGFFIGMPPEKQSSLLLVTEDLTDYWDMLMGSGKHHSNPVEANQQVNYNSAQPAAPALLVQIPAPKKDLEEQKQRSELFTANDDSRRSGTKYYIQNFLKLLNSRRQ